MAIFTGGFETGTNGNTITTGDAGNSSAWTTVSIPAGSSVVYDNTHSYDRLAAKLATTTPGTEAYVGWSIGAATTIHFGRLYAYFTAFPSINLIVTTDAGNLGSAIQIDSSGLVKALDSGGTVQATSTRAISLNQWMRFEFMMQHSTTVGQIIVKIFHDPNASGATETITTGNINTRGQIDAVFFGIIISSTNLGPIWIDNVIANMSTWPGPINNPTFVRDRRRPRIFAPGLAR